jgi:hypothetical protein
LGPIGFGAQGGEAACVLGVEQVANSVNAIGGQRHRARCQGFDKIRQGKIDADTAHARGLQRLDGHRQDLADGGDAVAADQLRAGLAQLAFGPELGGAQLQDRAAISQPERTRAVAHSGGGDAADLRGDVRAQRQRALGNRIDEPHQLLRAGGLEPRHQLFLELGQRRADPFVAVRADGDDHPVHQARRCFGVRRQPVAQSFGEEAGGNGHDEASLAGFRRSASGRSEAALRTESRSASWP